MAGITDCGRPFHCRHAYHKNPHPPGGATALIAVIGSQKIHNLGYFYALIPGDVGPVIMLVVALLVNNIHKNRRYPEF
jgi:CBS-domain-containing membrane protein